MPYSGCPLLLRDGLNVENQFHYVQLSMIVCDNKEVFRCSGLISKPWMSDSNSDGLPLPTSSLRKYGTGRKLGKQAESIPLMAVGSPATWPLIIWSYTEIRWQKTTSHVPASTARRSAGFLIRHSSLSYMSPNFFSHCQHPTFTPLRKQQQIIRIY